jgi:hypothetical protein
MYLHRSSGREEPFEELCARLGLDPTRLQVSPENAPRRPIVGVSGATATKLHELRYIIDVIASYTVNINRGRVARGEKKLEPFIAIDLSAGMGAYLYANKPHVGSPLLLLEALERRELQYRLLLVERDPSVIPLLKQNLDTATRALNVDPARVDVLEAEFTSAEEWIRRNVKSWTLGTMVVDINDLFASPSLRIIAQRPELARVDVLIHVPGTLSKWPRRIEPLVPIDEVLSWFGKAHWQVARARGNFQWIWCYGTNNPRMRELRQARFVSTETTVGQERLDMVRFTSAERRRRLQPSFFDVDFDLAGAAG